MKLLQGLLGVPLISQLALALTNPTIYISSSEYSSDSSISSISSRTARLLLARRLDLSSFVSLGSVEDVSLKVLNKYSQREQPLALQKSLEQSEDQLLIIVTAVNAAEDVLDTVPKTQLVVDEVVPTAAYKTLASDLLSWSQHSTGNYATKKPEVIYIDTLESLAGADHDEVQDATSNIKRIISNSIVNHQTYTVMLIPPFDSSSDAAQVNLRRQHFDGTQSTVSHIETSMSSAASTTSSSSTTTSSKATTSTDSSLATDLSSSSSSSATSSLSSPSSSLSSSSSTTSEAPSRQVPTALPKGPLQQCYSSAELLNSNTNNCSFHGHPVQRSLDCFACKCVPTIIRSGKTMRWGGAACQKKDVSMPFWLIGGVSIVLVATVAWGIGLLFAIGQESLPGVIAAGVVGPRAQK